MATAEELFSSLNSEEPHIIINSDRTITIPDELKNAAVQYDHNIETVTFDCPRYWDGNDLSEMIVSINYKRSDGHEGSYTCKNVVVDGNDSNIMHFDWTISNDATQVAGDLVFIVCVKKEHIDGYTSQVWHSQRCETFSVIKGLKCIQAPIIPSDPEYSGVQADYNQNSETAADYIKNRPFFNKLQKYTFTEDDYKSPVASIDSDNSIYKLSDDIISIDALSVSTISIRNLLPTEEDPDEVHRDIPMWVDFGNGSVYPGDPNDVYMTLTVDDGTGNVPENIYEDTQAILGDGICFIYKEYKAQEDPDITLSPGIYAIIDQQYRPEDLTINNIKKIDSSFLPTDNIIKLILQNSINESTINNMITDRLKSINSHLNNVDTSLNSIRSDINNINNVSIKNIRYDIDNASKYTSNMRKDVDTLQQNIVPIKSLYIDNATRMFLNCDFTSLPLIVLSSNYFTETFKNCSKMTFCNIASSDRYKPKNIDEMFYNCVKLTDISSNTINIPCLDLSECTSALSTFYECSNLTTIYLITSIKISLDFSWCPLDDKTVDMILSNLLPVTESQAITFKPNILDKITDEQLAKVPSGWVIH
mgnify:CR=1 FL=1|jgi:hypothetical protein